MNNLRGAKIIYQESKATQPSHLYLPTMKDIYVSLSNRQETYVFTSQQF